MIVLAASQPVVQLLTFATAALLMVLAGTRKRRLTWRPPDRSNRRRWFRGGRPRTSGR